MQLLPCVYSLPMKHFVEPFTYLESDKNKVDVTQIEATSTLQISSLVCEWLSTIDRTETMWISATVWSVLIRHWHGWQHCADVLGLLVKNRLHQFLRGTQMCCVPVMPLCVNSIYRLLAAFSLKSTIADHCLLFFDTFLKSKLWQPIALLHPTGSKCYCAVAQHSRFLNGIGPSRKVTTLEASFNQSWGTSEWCGWKS